MNKTAYIFPGQGSQFVGMGEDVYEKYDCAKKVFDEADEVLDYSIKNICFHGPEDELKRTLNSQPALLTHSYAMMKVAEETGITKKYPPSYMAGHSLGEYSALASDHALKFQDAVRLAHVRGKLMNECAEKTAGSMSAIIALKKEDVEAVCKDTGTYPANFNCPGQIVISGESDKIKEAAKLAKEKGAKLAISLAVSGAFHSPLMQNAADNLKPFIDKCEMKMPDVPVVGNTKARYLKSVDQMKEELANQVCMCVQWEDTIQLLLSEGVDTFIEVGPGTVLCGLIKRIAPEAVSYHIGNIEDVEALLKQEA